MSSVLDRDALENSPLADLHLLANELGVDGFRRLRKAELIDAIIARQSGAEEPAEAEEEEAPAPRRRSRTRPVADADLEAEPETEEEGATDEDAPARVRRGRRGGRGRGRREDGDEGARDRGAEEHVAEGVVELLGNGSAFIRLGPDGETTDDDVYVSAAQVKRCELVTGDRIAGPVRAPRRSERFPSLVRVDTINGRPAEEVAEGTKFEDLHAAWPTERLALGSEDVTLKAVEWLTPFGKGSRVLICGGPRAGKSELARDIVEALSGRDGLELLVVLAGVRPEEAGDWSEPAPVASVSFAGSPDAQAQAVEQAVEQGRRVAARGGDAVVVIDTLEYVQPHVARRALAAARNIADGGSLTVIATAPAPFGGESTVVALDTQLTALRRFPALDLAGSGTLRADALVGEAGAEAIARARAEAANS
ncbi:MAG TPA: Rho termination factor N-terminal domain-containing protein [Solirubrobacteraceae bacterium]|nr:Rho termination factor N-terminal domain-containing protein [Solirubrobacteraceae bacterium]